jgi:hypothetical protein
MAKTQKRVKFNKNSTFGPARQSWLEAALN